MLLAAAHCGGPQDCPRTAPLAAAPPLPPVTPSAATTASPASSADEAKTFFASVDKELRRLWIARDRAGWVNQNFITDDTEALSAAGEEATSEYVGRVIKEATRF